MKDLIAKLQMDATCAMGAIWLHIEAREKRIAELEAENINLRYELNAALSGGTVSCPSASTALQAPVREVPETAMSALVAALQDCLDYGSMTGSEWVADQAREAIKQATGGQK